MAVVYSKVLLFDPPLIYTAPDICVFGAVWLLLFSPDEACESDGTSLCYMPLSLIFHNVTSNFKSGHINVIWHYHLNFYGTCQ